VRFSEVAVELERSGRGILPARIGLLRGQHADLRQLGVGHRHTGVCQRVGGGPLDRGLVVIDAPAHSLAGVLDHAIASLQIELVGLDVPSRLFPDPRLLVVGELRLQGGGDP
jgi:hypothetical protein